MSTIHQNPFAYVAGALAKTMAISILYAIVATCEAVVRYANKLHRTCLTDVDAICGVYRSRPLR
jgi:hypothetical protein